MDRIASFGTVVRNLGPKETIRPKQVESICGSLGYQFGESELTLALLSLGHNGTISSQDFIKWWTTDSRFSSLQIPEKELENLMKCVEYYQHFDHDENGSLDEDEFEALHTDLHKRQFISISFKESFEGVAVDGIVSFGRYVRWLILNRAISISLDRIVDDALSNDNSYSDDDVYEDDDDDVYDDDDDDDDDDGSDKGDFRLSDTPAFRNIAEIKKGETEKRRSEANLFAVNSSSSSSSSS
eukprot:CAMPEP_0201477718 /NCGR_PEP_ID=MMETSP0151_2-20130828/2689_1 /ASSEMBLY_ACC=CAM_ASM_000257 /TAXON_ID=200890 /ORGANISM="Paramoeba atlantica, Strain 621/1 / CCAP 1560/9" /LENGTH=240 /DNA_ID=CAMNT_0047858531 /DNA_START=146 /DNA_END=865 /DNA_ORIENTATION=+